MTTHEHSVELAGVNLAGSNHVCAFFNTIDEEQRVLGSFYKDGLDRGEKAAHIVEPANREEHLKRLAEAGINVQQTRSVSCARSVDVAISVVLVCQSSRTGL